MANCSGHLGVEQLSAFRHLSMATGLKNSLLRQQLRLFREVQDSSFLYAYLGVAARLGLSIGMFLGIMAPGYGVGSAEKHLLGHSRRQKQSRCHLQAPDSCQLPSFSPCPLYIQIQDSPSNKRAAIPNGLAVPAIARIE